MRSIKYRCTLWSVDVSSSDAFDRKVFFVSPLSDHLEVFMYLSPSSSKNAICLANQSTDIFHFRVELLYKIS